MNPLPTRHHPALTGNSLLDGVGKIGCIGLYLPVFAMAASGMATALQAAARLCPKALRPTRHARRIEWHS